MGDILMQLYQRLPRPARSAAATLRGAYLRWWRYGPRSEQLEHEAHEREYWDVERWEQETGERLAFVLHRAATRVPYYREHWAERRRRGDHAAWDLLENWPLLDKETVRQNPRAFLADDCNPKRMFHQRTSGTTGTPLDLWRNRATLEAWYALAMARTRRWHGVHPDDRWARLGGQLVIPPEQRQPPFWVWNAASRQLYMSTYHLAPDLIPAYLDALVQYRIVSMSVYTSSAYALALEALRLGREDLRMRVVFTNAEPLSAHERETISRAFHCAVRETYGLGEIVTGASECAEGRLHRWPEAGVVEILDKGASVAAGKIGEFVCTGLLNADMPLVRYRVGDRGHLAPTSERCACGRTLPMFGGIEGRTDDLLVTRDGRLVSRFGPVFYGIPVRQGQIVQESVDRIRVRYAPTPEFTAQNGRMIVERLLARMGDMQVELEELEEIPRSANGKLRQVVCNIPNEERDAVLARAQS